MNTRLHIHYHGSTITVRISSTAMGSTISASLSGPILYALVDGLLWWCINAKLTALVGTAQGQPAPTDRDASIFFAQGLVAGEELVMQCFTTPFYEHHEERQARIVDYITRKLPGLQPIADHGPHSTIARAELAELQQLCTMLHQRIQDPANAMLALEEMLTAVDRTAA